MDDIRLMFFRVDHGIRICFVLYCFVNIIIKQTWTSHNLIMVTNYLIAQILSSIMILYFKRDDFPFWLSQFIFINILRHDHWDQIINKICRYYGTLNTNISSFIIRHIFYCKLATHCLLLLSLFQWILTQVICHKNIECSKNNYFWCNRIHQILGTSFHGHYINDLYVSLVTLYLYKIVRHCRNIGVNKLDNYVSIEVIICCLSLSENIIYGNGFLNPIYTKPHDNSVFVTLCYLFIMFKISNFNALS